MYKVELERKPTVINEYRYLNSEGQVVVSTTPIYANQITLDFKNEYGVFKYTDYFIHRPTEKTDYE